MFAAYSHLRLVLRLLVGFALAALVNTTVDSNEVQNLYQKLTNEAKKALDYYNYRQEILDKELGRNLTELHRLAKQLKLDANFLVADSEPKDRDQMINEKVTDCYNVIDLLGKTILTIQSEDTLLKDGLTRMNEKLTNLVVILNTMQTNGIDTPKQTGKFYLERSNLTDTFKEIKKSAHECAKQVKKLDDEFNKAGKQFQNKLEKEDELSPNLKLKKKFLFEEMFLGKDLRDFLDKFALKSQYSRIFDTSKAECKSNLQADIRTLTSLIKDYIKKVKVMVKMVNKIKLNTKQRDNYFKDKAKSNVEASEVLRTRLLNLYAALFTTKDQEFNIWELLDKYRKIKLIFRWFDQEYSVGLGFIGSSWKWFKEKKLIWAKIFTLGALATLGLQSVHHNKGPVWDIQTWKNLIGLLPANKSTALYSRDQPSSTLKLQSRPDSAVGHFLVNLINHPVGFPIICILLLVTVLISVSALSRYFYLRKSHSKPSIRNRTNRLSANKSVSSSKCPLKGSKRSGTARYSNQPKNRRRHRQ